MHAPICAAAVAVALAAAVPSAARSPAAGPTIVFATTRTSHWQAADVFVVGVTGRPRNTTTTPGVHESDPDWSPRGAELAFSRQRSGNTDIYVRDAAVSVRRLTTAPEADTSPVWSPDGEQIAFIRATDGRGSLWVMNRDGSGQRALSRMPAEILSPSWSADGSRVAYLEARKVAVADVAAGGGTRIVRDRQDTLALLWRADGRIAVVLDGPNGARRIVSLEAAGGGVRDEPNPCDTDQPHWSKDQRHLLCTEPDRTAARIVDTDGHLIKRLTLAPRNQSVQFAGFSLAAGGERLAFAALVEEKDADLAVAGATGATTRVVMIHPDEEIDPVLSRDGARIAFVRASYQTSDGEGALLLLDRASRRVRWLAARAADPSWSPDGRHLVFSRNGDLHRIRLADRRVTRLTRGRSVDVDPA